jgi:hypothetical protein
MTHPRRAVIALAAVALLAACNSGPKQPDQPPPNPIKDQIDAGRNGAKADSAAIKQSEDRMNAQAAEAAGDTTAKQQ